MRNLLKHAVCAAVLLWSLLPSALPSDPAQAVFLVEWPRRSREAIELPAGFPVGQPFFTLRAVAVPLSPNTAATPDDLTARLRYSLVSATQSPPTARPAAPNPFSVHAVTGDVTLTDTMEHNGGQGSRHSEWNLVVEARVQAGETKKSNRSQLHVRVLSQEEQAKACETTRKVCFGHEGHRRDYAIDEQVKAGTVLDLVRPVTMGALCPDSRPTYVIRQDGDSWLALDARSGQLYLSRPVVWSESATVASSVVTARLVCSLAGHPNETVKVSLKVKDIDDQPPRAQTESSLVCKTSMETLRKGDTLGCRISVLDHDSVEVNKFSVRLEHDALNLFELVRPPFQAFITDKKMTFLNAEVGARTTGASFPGDKYTFAVVVEDTGLVLSDVHNKVEFLVEVSNSSTLRTPLSLRETYNVSLSRNATTLARVLSSMTSPASNHRFRLAQEDPARAGRQASQAWLAVTPRTGILYVSNADNLRNFNGSETSVLLEASWKDESGHSLRHLYRVEVHVQDVEDGSNGETCEGRLCGQELSEAQCSSSCGLGTADGRCRWRHGLGGRHLTTLYSTCTGDPESCPDGNCDELESLHPTLCPQDCAKHVVGEAVAGPSRRGIEKAMGICSCASAESCTCTQLPARPDSRDSVLAPAAHPWSPLATRRPAGTQSATAAAAAAESSQINDEPGPVAGASCGAGCVASLCVAGLFVSFLALAALGAVVRRRRAAAKHKYLGSRASLSVPSDYVDGRSAATSAAVSTDAGTQAPFSTPHPPATRTPFAKLQVDEQWEFPRENLFLEQSLGQGEFGRVVRARARDIAGVRGFTTVAVKMLKGNWTPSEEEDLLSEFCMLKEVNHPNVIRLLGGCTTKGGPLYVIVEYAELGSLLNVLRRSRHMAADVVCNPTYMAQESPADGSANAGPAEACFQHPVPTYSDLLCYAWQIAKGMAYLADMKLVHRDLAARNILLAQGNVIKISDFGLSRDVYEGDTYLKKSRGRVPVKWMALESLEDEIYTSKSDVWSFGVVLWEIVTLGASPYPGVGPEYLFQLLKTGYRMHQPEDCSQEIYRMMLSCWQARPQDRPSFKELRQRLEDILQDSASYLELNGAQNRSYYNLSGGAPSMKPLLGEQSDDGECSEPPEYGCMDFERRGSFPRRRQSEPDGSNVRLLTNKNGCLVDSPVVCWLARPEVLSRDGASLERPKQLL